MCDEKRSGRRRGGGDECEKRFYRLLNPGPNFLLHENTKEFGLVLISFPGRQFPGSANRRRKVLWAFLYSEHCRSCFPSWKIAPAGLRAPGGQATGKTQLRPQRL